VPPERRRRATRRETRGFEWIKIHSITARHRIAVSAIVAARPSRRACLLHPPSREKMKPEKRIARVNRIVVSSFAVPVVLPDTDARVRRAQINANGGSVSFTHVCVRVCRHNECAS
jgi:hypothetical protein